MNRTTQIELERHVAWVAQRLKRRAAKGTFDGRESARNWLYLRSCAVGDALTQTKLIFTRDTGHHTSGWMRNPEFERCLHLSLSPLPPELVAGVVPAAVLGKATIRLWLRAVFGDDARLTWLESAKTRIGREHQVLHFRLFCDPGWTPIHPRGEVYSSEFTEKGWRSASQVLEEDRVQIISPLDPT
ncbi:MAG: hypothetical protein ACK4N5_08095 [Myxococcales bacterium]